MRFSVVTIFPEMVQAYIGASIIKRAVQKGIIEISLHNLRDFAADKHKTVDDYSYGGGVGMVMKPEPFFRIVEERWPKRQDRRIIVPSPRGGMFGQQRALELSREKREIVLLCGRYEAIDERVMEHLADEEISIGDYVLTGGELPSLVIIDAVARLIPGVLGDSRSSEEDSFSCGLLDYPHYTRPENFRGIKVPEVLLSGNHRAVSEWRKKRSLQLTMQRRPALLEQYVLTPEEKDIAQKIKEELDELDGGS
jgi:tRNA (guanine37-N1)-methyltransferase